MRLPLPALTRLQGAPGYRTARRVGRRLTSDDVGLLAGALAYQFFLSLFPFAVFVAAISGALARYLGLPDVSELLLSLADQLPPALGGVLRNELRTIVGADTSRLVSVTAVGMLWAATYGTNTLLLAMDRAYAVGAARRGLQRLLMAGGLTLLAGWALVAAGLIFALVVIFGRTLRDLTNLSGSQAPPQAAFIDPEGSAVWVWAALGILALFAAGGVYRLAPNVTQRWTGVIPGAVFFAASWLLGTATFSVYVTYFATYGLTYGALAGVVALLVWLYLTAYLLLAGAVLNAVLQERWPDGAPGREA